MRSTAKLSCEGESCYRVRVLTSKNTVTPPPPHSDAHARAGRVCVYGEGGTDVFD